MCSAGLLRAEGVRHEKRVGHVRSSSLSWTKLGQARPFFPSEFEVAGWKEVLFWEYWDVLSISMYFLKVWSSFVCFLDDSSPFANFNEVQLGEWQPDSCSPSEQRDCAGLRGGLQPRAHLVKQSSLVSESYWIILNLQSVSEGILHFLTLFCITRTKVFLTSK